MLHFRSLFGGTTVPSPKILFGLVMSVLTSKIVCLLGANMSHDIIQGVGDQYYPLYEVCLDFLRQIAPRKLCN